MGGDDDEGSDLQGPGGGESPRRVQASGCATKHGISVPLTAAARAWITSPQRRGPAPRIPQCARYLLRDARLTDPTDAGNVQVPKALRIKTHQW